MSDGTTQGLADLQLIVGKPIQGSVLRVLMSAPEGREVETEREKQDRTGDMARIRLPYTPPPHTIYKQDTPRSTPTDGSWSEGRAAQGRPRSFHEMREQTTMPYVTTTVMMDDMATMDDQHHQQTSEALTSLTVGSCMPDDTPPLPSGNDGGMESAAGIQP